MVNICLLASTAGATLKLPGMAECAEFSVAPTGTRADKHAGRVKCEAKVADASATVSQNAKVDREGPGLGVDLRSKRRKSQGHHGM